MTRLSRVGLVLATVVLFAVAIWWGMLRSTPPPNQQSVGGLSDSVSVTVGPNGFASIQAETPRDALTGLGYAHGLQRGWTATLWRRTALGRLSEWFGPGTQSLDRHALRLGLGHHARAAYNRLPDSTQHHLQAYVEGLNAALRSTYVQEQAPLVLLDRSPTAWEPWHPLVVERLLAWVGTEPLAPPSDAPEAVTDFHRVDQQWRRWLHLHGWNRSVMWALPPTSDTPSTLFQRHVLGATATPTLQEVHLQWPGTGAIRSVTVPGVPLFPTGTVDERAWGILLKSTATLQPIAPDSAARRTWHERIAPTGGEEELVTVRRQDSTLPLTTPPDSTAPAPDSLWAIQWPGFSNQSDLGAWLHTPEVASPAPSPSFRLFDTAGLRVPADGAPQVIGSPPVVESAGSDSALVVGASHWSRYQARSLAATVGDPNSDIGPLSTSDSSTWASTLLTRYEDDLRPFTEAPPPAPQALAYLRNWDHQYDRASIGASLFEHWMQSYREEIGRFPSSPSEAPYFASHRRRQAFHQALDTLTARYGSDVRRWRWERVAPDRRYFPVWSADSLVNADLTSLAQTRYAPLERPGRGHPSALAGGRSLADPVSTAPSPTAWNGWMVPRDASLTVRRLRFDPDGFFARALLSSDRPPAQQLTVPKDGTSTVLVPESSP